MCVSVDKDGLIEVIPWKNKYRIKWVIVDRLYLNDSEQACDLDILKVQ